jgi:hypothetical protein
MVFYSSDILYETAHFVSVGSFALTVKWIYEVMIA